MSADPDGFFTVDGFLALTEAQVEMLLVENSGFSSDLKMSSLYSLDGPVVNAGPVTRGLSVEPEPSPDWVVGQDELAILVSALGHGRGQSAGWAAAAFEDGSFCLSSGWGASYIPPGVYLPRNVDVLVGGVGDGVGWRLYGAAPAERLLGYAVHGGWLDKITSVVAERVRRPMGWGDPFDRIAPLLGRHADRIELVCLDGRSLADWRWAMRMDGGSGGRHRLDVVDSVLYAQLCERVRGDVSTVDAVLRDAAELTVAAARAALGDSGRVLGKIGVINRSGAQEVAQVLDAVAGSDPVAVVGNRIAAIDDVGGAFGAPSHRAPAWAALADRAYYLLRLSGGYIQGCVAEDALAAFSRGGDEPSELVIEYARMLRLRAAVEAVLLWSADPLPVADIEYAAGIAIGRF